MIPIQCNRVQKGMKVRGYQSLGGSSFTVGDDVRGALGSVAFDFKWGLSGSTNPFHGGSPSLCQDFTSRCLGPGAAPFELASSLSGLQICPSRHSGHVRVAPSLVANQVCGTLCSHRWPSSWGPLGPALGFYRARVRCLDVALLNSNSKAELGATKHGRDTCSIVAQIVSIGDYGDVYQRLQCCRQPMPSSEAYRTISKTSFEVFQRKCGFTH